MSNHLYILQPYKSIKDRHICQACNKKQVFSRYINSDTGEYLADHVGRCNREVTCGYHYKPAQYFADNNIGFDSAKYSKPQIQAAPLPVVPIPNELLKETLTGYENNTFVKYLISLFGEATTEQLIGKYYIGTTDKCGRAITGQWQAACVFWYIDIQKRIRAGQVKLFDESGHTAKYIDQKGEMRSCTDAIHTPLKYEYGKRNEPLPEWLANYIEGKKIFCFYGEQNLSNNKNLPVAICEAPKTAIIASIYLPGFVWLAVGALSYLTEERCTVLKARNVVLFPDLGAYEKWNTRASELKHITNFKVSDLLERGATEEQKKQGLDVADFLVQYSYKDFISGIYTKNFPVQKSANNYIENCDVVKPEVLQVEKLDLQNNPGSTEAIIKITQTRKSEVEKDRAEVSEVWDIETLEEFFISTAIPATPVALSACETIIDVPIFIEAHMGFIKANKRRKSYLPYFERLQKLKLILSESNKVAQAA